MSGAKSRNKGSAGERELARLLSDELGVEVVRRLGQARDGGHDLDGLQGWCLEVKRRARVTEADKRRWWEQVTTAAARSDDYTARAAVLYRADRGLWRAIVSLNDVAPSEWTEEYRDTADIGLTAFCQLVRERLPMESRKAG